MKPIDSLRGLVDVQISANGLQDGDVLAWSDTAGAFTNVQPTLARVLAAGANANGVSITNLGSLTLSTDVRIRRSAAKTLTIDDAAAGAIATVAVGSLDATSYKVGGAAGADGTTATGITKGLVTAAT